MRGWHPMDLQLTGKLALISGSTKGIGLAIATGLAREGAIVIVNGRSEKSVAEALAKIIKGVPAAQLRSFVGDLSDAAIVENLAGQFPAVEILVNNLGIFEPQPFEQIPDADWRRFFEINVLSGVRLSRIYLPQMKLKNWGRIIFISSESGIQIPRRNDPLRHDQDCATGRLARSRRNLRGDRRDRQRGASRTHSFGRCGRIRETTQWRQTVRRF
jgi:NAD(P)-dependent dehydrogenase (short-subunit alcohol dehydrogenase family)